MSKKDKHEEKEQKELKQEESKKEVSKEEELLARVKDLEKQLAEQTLSVIEKEKQIAELKTRIDSLNESYRAKASEISAEAQIKLDKKLKEYQDKYEAESKENKKYALASSISEFISILNQFDNAINQDVQDPKVKNYLMGLKMFLNMMKNWLKTNHVEMIKVNINDTYDPTFMEAIDTVKQGDSTDFKVTKIVENGYKLHDRVIRPVKVIVSNH